MPRFQVSEGKSICISFVIPMVLRLLPEIIAGPYPIGFDTVVYTSIIKRGIGVNLSYAPLLYLILIAVELLTRVDSFLLIKVSGAILYGLVGVAVFYFARHYLVWNTWKSLVASLFLTFQFVSLRISWDHFKNELGIIFLLFALPELKRLSSRKSNIKFAILSFLATLSHQLVSATLLFVVWGISVLNFTKSRSYKAFKPVLITLPAFIFLAIGTFLPSLLPRITQRLGLLHSSPLMARVGPIFNYLGEPNPWYPSNSYWLLFNEAWTLFLFGYALILFFVMIGFWFEPTLSFWTISLLIGSFSCLISPHAALSLSHRWMFMLVYPFSFYAVNGIERLQVRLNALKIMHRKTIPLTMVFLILFAVIALIYAAYPIPLLKNETGNRYIPPTMLQSSIALNDIPDTIKALEWLNEHMDNTSCVLVEERFLGWALIVLNANKNIVTYPVHLSPNNALDMALNAGFKKIYLLWYTSPTSIDVSIFKEVYIRGRTAVYIFTG